MDKIMEWSIKVVLGVLIGYCFITAIGLMGFISQV